jgi:tight adherence protein B
MNAIVAFCFLVIFALLLLSVGVGLRYYEAHRQKKLVAMFRTVTEGGREQSVNLLMSDGGDRDSMENALANLNIAGRITDLLTEAGLDWSLSRFVITCGFAFVVGGFIGLAAPVKVPAVLRLLGMGSLFAYLPLMIVKKKRAARFADLEAQLPDALDFLSRSMRAGHAFTISLEMVGEEIHEPLGQEFRSLFNEQNLGASLERSLQNFTKRVPLTDVRFFASAVLLQRQTGGNLAEILNRLSQIIRERFRLRGQVKAASGHGRLTATILTLLPIATLALLLMGSPDYLDPMFNDPTGRKLIAAGVMAQVIGNFFIRKIIRIKV